MDKITTYQIGLLQEEYKMYVSDEVFIKHKIPRVDNTIDLRDIDQETFYKIYKELIIHNTIDAIQVHIDALSDRVRDDIVLNKVG